MKLCAYCKENEVKDKRRKYCSNSCSALSRENVNDPDFSDNKELFWYFTGYVYGDGCLQNNGKNRRDSIIIISKDYELMNQLHPLICPRRKIGVRKRYSKNHSQTYSITTSNNSIISKLKSLGLTYSKTKTTKIPLVPRKYLNHFIRGYFDADGSIWENTVKTKKYFHISFTTGSYLFAIQLHELLTTLGFTPKIVKDKRHEAYYIKLYRQKEVSDFGKFLYDKATICLERKQKQFMMI